MVAKAETQAPAPQPGTFAFTKIKQEEVVSRARAGASLPASALAAFRAVHESCIGSASEYFAVPGEDEDARKKWLRGIRAAVRDLRATHDDGTELYPYGRKLLLGQTTGGLPIWAIGGAAKQRKPWVPKNKREAATQA